MAADTSRVVRLFIEALNARDIDALERLVTDDVELRTASDGALRGRGKVEALVRAAADAELVLIRQGDERIEPRSGQLRVMLPIKVRIRGGELRGNAEFDIRGDKVAAFEVTTNEQSRRRRLVRP